MSRWWLTQRPFGWSPTSGETRRPGRGEARPDAKAETLSLIYDDGVRWREALAPQVRIRDLRSGRAVPVAFSVVGQDLAVYVDGRLVMEARDARIRSGTLPPDIFVGEEGGVGSIRLVAARVYALP